MEVTSQEDSRNVTIEEKNTGENGGKLTLDEDVVATIAGLAAREVDGIHRLGRSKLMSFRDNPTRGVEAEVGKVEAAFDLDVIINYGIDIREMAKKLRNKIGEEVNKMAGRRVVEININVVGIHIPEPVEEPVEETTARVR
ncbi:MAG: Asp23/Gls24 family envelope stress response protein [Myxococcota bacterium]